MQPVYLIVLLDKKHNYVYIAQLISMSSFLFILSHIT